ncbi:winged helix-turn-helix domain-containing protein [Aeromicrobium sp.]|uniref:winged helix-turn-helix domain-containing protein n=1 Tax=Aeromicrobium sp. TaxID=1871063 RepID=UPI003C4A5952
MKVLVVEDEVLLARAVKRGLNAAGLTVDLVHNGEDGVWAATEGSYDAIVLDLMLPQLSGQGVIRELRRREVWTPVLVLTARHGSRDQVDVLDIGADDYLTKPFDLDVLAARLRALVRRGAAARPTVIEVGELRVDPAARTASRGAVDIRLTSREFSVLEFLSRHQGEVVTKTQIIQNVWDENFEGDPNVVEVYVRRLRQKIDIPFDCTSIKTVRGAGYQLSDG